MTPGTATLERPAEMTRAVITGPKELVFERLPVPEPGPSQVLVRMLASALCTWEQRTFVGIEKGYPLAGGHEYSGVAAAIGPSVQVSGLAVGDLVTVSGLPRCGQCYSCRHRADNLCDNARGPRVPGQPFGPGGFSEYVRAEGHQVFKVGPLATPEEAALSEPLACVLHDMKRHPVRANDVVVIVGAGIMGLLHLAVARRTPSFIIVSEPERVRREKALELGAHAVIDPATEDYVARVNELSGGRGANVTYVAIGVTGAIEKAVAAAAKRGVVSAYASVHPRGSTISVDPNIFHNREVTLGGSYSQERDDFIASAELIGRREIDLRPLISRTFPLSRLSDAFEEALRKDAYRVLVLPDAEFAAKA
ncbi:MAG: zinc-binding dehydrogenase [Chloroflexi bacterium]|nr:zinc-binding dehydrogenase [Chloroflexota bacterium]